MNETVTVSSTKPWTTEPDHWTEEKLKPAKNKMLGRKSWDLF